MGYSCSDFTDSILDALGIVVPEESLDSPSDQADLALAEIERRELRTRELLWALRAALTYLGDAATDDSPEAIDTRAVVRAAIAKA